MLFLWAGVNGMKSSESVQQIYVRLWGCMRVELRYQIMPYVLSKIYIKHQEKEKYDECHLVSTYTSINAKYVTKTEKRDCF